MKLYRINHSHKKNFQSIQFIFENREISYEIFKRLLKKNLNVKIAQFETIMNDVLTFRRWNQNNNFIIKKRLNHKKTFRSKWRAFWIFKHVSRYLSKSFFWTDFWCSELAIVFFRLLERSTSWVETLSKCEKRDNRRLLLMKNMSKFAISSTRSTKSFEIREKNRCRLSLDSQKIFEASREICDDNTSFQSLQSNDKSNVNSKKSTIVKLNLNELFVLITEKKS